MLDGGGEPILDHEAITKKKEGSGKRGEERNGEGKGKRCEAAEQESEGEGNGELASSPRIKAASSLVIKAASLPEI